MKLPGYPGDVNAGYTIASNTERGLSRKSTQKRLTGLLVEIFGGLISIVDEPSGLYAEAADESFYYTQSPQ